MPIDSAPLRPAAKIHKPSRMRKTLGRVSLIPKKLHKWVIIHLLPKGLRRRRELKAVDREVRSLEEKFRPLVDGAKTQEDWSILMSEWGYEESQLEILQNKIETDALLDDARRFKIPIPPRPYEKGEDETWFHHVDEEVWALKPEAYWKLRNLIRQEGKERRDYWIGWLPLISALTGLIGALSGLVAWLLR